MPSAVSTGSYTGSSPLTRGKLDQMPFHAEEIGLIPTHAGKTLMVVIMVSFCGAHPHSRGENRAFDVLSVGRMGSSPLTRGKLIDSGVGGGRGGLIPAHAGKTRTQFSIRAMQRAHPHSRGENVTRPREASVVCGSSPLTRGKQAHCLHQVVIGGLIPAHAGKTGHRTRGQTNSPAHPHSRGQNSCGHGSDPTLWGSSPLTRGKRQVERRHEGMAGLIPTHAGKTSHVVRGDVHAGDHPRSRGENLAHVQRYADNLGSSPLTRGKPVRVDGDRAVLRIIPAHAGKTPPESHPSRSPRDHPRSRGENVALAEGVGPAMGSSPLTRGKRRGQLFPLGERGLIPAHAGKTP